MNRKIPYLFSIVLAFFFVYCEKENSHAIDDALVFTIESYPNINRFYTEIEAHVKNKNINFLTENLSYDYQGYLNKSLNEMTEKFKRFFGTYKTIDYKVSNVRKVSNQGESIKISNDYQFLLYSSNEKKSSIKGQEVITWQKTSEGYKIISWVHKSFRSSDKQ